MLYLYLKFLFFIIIIFLLLSLFVDFFIIESPTEIRSNQTSSIIKFGNNNEVRSQLYVSKQNSSEHQQVKQHHK
jgi:hypothetical protein